MRKRTKIVCTMGPAVASFEKIVQLIDAGMNVARLNFSHGTHEDHRKTIELLKKAREEKKIPLAIMLDTKGPEIRLGKVKDGQFSVEAGQTILFVKEEIEGDAKKMQIHPAIALDAMEKGTTVLFDDGYIIGKVVEITTEGVKIEIKNNGVFKTHKGVNVPGVAIDLPAMTQQDIADITFGCQHNIDLIAASFIRSAEHVLEIKKLLRDLGKEHVMVLAKIENSLGVQNFDRIIEVADGVMVARGDLGVELPMNQVPGLQKMMIRKCYLASKPVVTATQMLESMTKNPRPTRAEVSDVANAIYDSTSAVMLSGETAVGQYPVETVEMMRSIIEESEKNFSYREFCSRDDRNCSGDISLSVALATVKTAYSVEAKAIFALTLTGFTARQISQYRPEMPILALTPHVNIYHQLALLWGVIPVDPCSSHNVAEAFRACCHFAMQKGILKDKDPVIVTAGSPFGVSGTTNMMIVDTVH